MWKSTEPSWMKSAFHRDNGAQANFAHLDNVELIKL
jgi:hypothetical protein